MSNIYKQKNKDEFLNELTSLLTKLLEKHREQFFENQHPTPQQHITGGG